MLETTFDTNYSTVGILETTLDVNYSIGGMLETTLDNNYSTGGMMEITQNVSNYYPEWFLASCGGIINI